MIRFFCMKCGVCVRVIVIGSGCASGECSECDGRFALRWDPNGPVYAHVECDLTLPKESE